MLNEHVARARARLEGAHIAEAALDARLLAQFVLGWDAARYFTAAGEPPPADFLARYEALVTRRAAREPLAYITGDREFWNLSFEVSPAVLIPRPETELIVETAIARFPDRGAPLSIADVCTGSGCLAVALAREYARARVVAADLSGAALDVAGRNAARHGVADRVRLIATDLLQGIPDLFDLIVANPPYVSEGDRPALVAEVREYEPELALFAGRDGLAVIRRLVEESVERLVPGGTLIFELGFWQAPAVATLISGRSGLELVEIRPDLQGIPRAAIAIRHEASR